MFAFIGTATRVSRLSLDLDLDLDSSHVGDALANTLMPSLPVLSGSVAAENRHLPS